MFSTILKIFITLVCFLLLLEWRLRQKAKALGVVHMKTGEPAMTKSFLFQWINIFSALFTGRNLRESTHEEIENNSIPDVLIEFEGFTPTVTIAGPQGIKEVLSHRGCEKADESIGSNPHSIRMFGHSLLHQNGKKALKTRTIMNPAFKLKKLTSLIPTFRQCSNEMVYMLNDKFQENTPIKIDNWLKHLTFDIIGKTGFGYSFDCLTKESNPEVENFITCFQGIGQPLVMLFGPHAEKIPTEYQKILKKALRDSTKLILDVINDRRKTRNPEDPPNDLLDLILDADEKGDLTNEELVSNTFLLFLAGQETSASSLVTSIYYLGFIPEIQQKAYEEVINVCGLEGEINEEHLSKLNYLEAILNESLRILSPVGGTTTRITTEDIVVDDYFIPKGVNLQVTWTKAHRSGLFFESPSVYDPNRWLENPKLVNSMHAFSYGPRICIGKNFAILEMKIVLATLLRSFSWSLPTAYKYEIDDFSLALRPKGGLDIILKRR